MHLQHVNEIPISDKNTAAALDALERSEESLLFNAKTISELEKSNELMPYLICLLRSSRDDREKSSRIRLICFQKSIILLKSGSLSEEHGKILLDRCGTNVRNILYSVFCILYIMIYLRNQNISCVYQV